ncbi:MAG: hypothetical protein KatS3mg131_3775 [Candidatus Tectimicrobiota bacterium]|nr:MAG: hypothetical protein KatS3mg131_3775 [Candidatus Tectomicrobia bacterium]
MPPELEGLTAIKTANNDKYNASAQFLTFTLSGPATLYVAYDSRATQYPAWLTQDFVNTGLVIETGDVPLVVWQRSLAAGTHSLPGNYFGSPQGVHSNYLVLLDLGGQAPVPGWLWSQAGADSMPVLFLDAGVYTLVIKQRESGTQLDRLLLTSDVEYVPQGLGEM